MKRRYRSRSLTDFYNRFGIYMILIVLVVICAILSDSFLTMPNLILFFRQNAIITIITCGTLVVLISGEMDFSQGAIAAFGGCMAVLLTHTGKHVGIAVAGGLLAGVLFGALNGIIVTKCKIPSFIMTLATQRIARGAIMAYQNGRPAYSIGNLIWFSQGRIGGVIPIQIVFMVLVLLLTWFILNRTSLGRQIYAVGGNVKAAETSGIHTDRIKIFAFIFAGVMAAFGGIILMARMRAGQPTGAEGYEFTALTAVIIGGTSLMGGEGNIYGMFAGTLSVGVLNNFMTITRVNSYWQQVVQGILIAITVIVDARVHERRRKLV